MEEPQQAMPKTKPSQYGVGFSFLQRFSTGISVGKVSSVNLAKGGGTGTRHVIYNDGDEAILHPWEIKAHVKNHGTDTTVMRSAKAANK